jgi:hypothetical protein
MSDLYRLYGHRIVNFSHVLVNYTIVSFGIGLLNCYFNCNYIYIDTHTGNTFTARWPCILNSSARIHVTFRPTQYNVNWIETTCLNKTSDSDLLRNVKVLWNTRKMFNFICTTTKKIFVGKYCNNVRQRTRKKDKPVCKHCILQMVYYNYSILPIILCMRQLSIDPLKPEAWTGYAQY